MVPPHRVDRESAGRCCRHITDRFPSLSVDRTLAAQQRMESWFLGVQMLGEKIAALEADGEPFPGELRLQLEHLIVSHHGAPEFGGVMRKN